MNDNLFIYFIFGLGLFLSFLRVLRIVSKKKEEFLRFVNYVGASLINDFQAEFSYQGRKFLLSIGSSSRGESTDPCFMISITNPTQYKLSLERVTKGFKLKRTIQINKSKLLSDAHFNEKVDVWVSGADKDLNRKLLESLDVRNAILLTLEVFDKICFTEKEIMFYKILRYDERNINPQELNLMLNQIILLLNKLPISKSGK